MKAIFANPLCHAWACMSQKLIPFSFFCRYIKLIFCSHFVLKISDYKIEQRCVIKFCLKLGINATKNCKKLQEVYGKDALSRAQIFKWFKNFSAGRDSVQDVPRSGRSTKIKKLTKM